MQTRRQHQQQWWEDLLIDDVRDRIVQKDCDPLCRAMVAITSRRNYQRYLAGPDSKWRVSISKLCFRYDYTTRLTTLLTRSSVFRNDWSRIYRYLLDAIVGANFAVLKRHDYLACSVDGIANAVAQSEGLEVIHWLEKDCILLNHYENDFCCAAARHGNLVVLDYLMTKGGVIDPMDVLFHAMDGRHLPTITHVCERWMTPFHWRRGNATVALEIALRFHNLAVVEIIHKYQQTIFSRAFERAVASGEVARVQWVYDRYPQHCRDTPASDFTIYTDITPAMVRWLRQHGFWSVLAVLSQRLNLLK